MFCPPHGLELGVCSPGLCSVASTEADGQKLQPKGSRCGAHLSANKSPRQWLCVYLRYFSGDQRCSASLECREDQLKPRLPVVPQFAVSL